MHCWQYVSHTEVNKHHSNMQQAYSHLDVPQTGGGRMAFLLRSSLAELGRELVADLSDGLLMSGLIVIRGSIVA
jgi:hypothetical protein